MFSFTTFIDEIYSFHLNMTDVSTKTEASHQDPVDNSLEKIVARIPHLVKKEDIGDMINLQVAAMERLEATNKSLDNCNSLAQDKLLATSKLFKKTAKQMNEAKKDLDVIYKKILDMKRKIRAERPDLFETNKRLQANDEDETSESG